MGLSEDVTRIAAAAAAYAAPGEEVAAVLPIELASGERVYLCAFAQEAGGESWLALEDDGSSVRSRTRVRDAASIAALVEVAEEGTDAVLAGEPRLASLSYLDSLGASAVDGSVAGAIQSAAPAVDELARDIVGNYRLGLT